MHDPLTPEALLPRGPLVRLGRRCFVFTELDSTNAHLLRLAAELPDGTVVCAEYQFAGRGRLGRRWVAPRGASVLLSVLLKEPVRSGPTRCATVLAAVAACEAVERTGPCRPTIRWPNDLVLAGRKLGGILVESTPLPGGDQRAIVIGIGINCLQQPGHFPPDLAASCTSLEMESPDPVDRAAVARALLERLDARLAGLEHPHTVSELLKAWKNRCMDFGRRVRLLQDRQTFTGTVLDISDEGDLVVQLDQGGRRLFGSATTTRLP